MLPNTLLGIEEPFGFCSLVRHTSRRRMFDANQQKVYRLYSVNRAGGDEVLSATGV
jgi:hypothetical protein